MAISCAGFEWLLEMRDALYPDQLNREYSRIVTVTFGWFVRNATCD